MLIFILIVLFVLASIGVLYKLWIRSRALQIAADRTKHLFPVWAAQGPFESGAQSEAALRYACLATRGPEETEQMSEAIAKHAVSYDSNPAKWEQTRKEALRSADPETEKFLKIAKELIAMDSLSKDQI